MVGDGGGDGGVGGDIDVRRQLQGWKRGVVAGPGRRTSRARDSRGIQLTSFFFFRRFNLSKTERCERRRGSQETR